MPKTGFGSSTTEIFLHRNGATSATQWIGDTVDLPVGFAQDSRPRRPWEIRRVPGGPSNPQTAHIVDGWFEIDDTNKYIDMQVQGSSAVVVTLTKGRYSGATLAAQVQTRLQAVDSDWTCTWNSTTGVFEFDHTDDVLGTPARFLWLAGTHGTENANDNAGKELGFVRFVDEFVGLDTGYVFYLAGEPRHWTHTWCWFKQTEPGLTKSAEVVLCQVADLPDIIGDRRIDSSDIKIFVGSGFSADFTRGTAEDVSAYDAEFSERPTSAQNPIRVATFGWTGTKLQARSGDQWFFSWRHWDPMPYRHVNLLKAMTVVLDDSSAGRTNQELTRHGLVDSSPSLGIFNYYPVAIEERWVASVEFGEWGAASYREVVHEIVREGRHTGLLWALRWDDIAQGTVTGKAEVDKGFVIWGALTDYSLDTYSGSASDYISGSVDIEQIR